MKILIKIFCVFLPFGLFSQVYTDYLGAGHAVGISVTSSDDNAETPPSNTITGKGLDSKTFEAGRFFSQATVGATPQMVTDMVASDNDFEAWIDDQFNIPATHIQPEMESIWDILLSYYIAQGVEEEDIFGPAKKHFDYAWWQINLTSDDVLRQKIAFALSQILVISENSDLGGWGEALSSYYDMLLDNSFGNYRDLLEEVTYSIQMGYYLSHLNNAKENLEANTSPDENYAREIMQLFSIGLYELNPDGTRALDANGDPIPTYDQDDIQEYAKVFTGLGIGELEYPENWPYDPFFGLGIWAAVKDAPMVMYDDFHETEAKTLLGGEVLPANQTGAQDISDAIDNLFNHPNVGPFIGTLLIKRLVKSNPTPAYVARVTAAFNDNGSGVRGDMEAVIKAILLDDEARLGSEMLTPSSGRVKEPLMRYTSFIKAMPFFEPNNRFWNIGAGYRDATGQGVLSSPTVFNFYSPDFQPVGDLTIANLTAPELKLHNTSTSFKYINEIYTWLYWGEEEWFDGMPSIMNVWEVDEIAPVTRINQNEFLIYADRPEILVNELDKLLTFGQLSDETRDIILPILHDTYWSWNDDWKLHRVKSAIYYIMLSPDFNIMK